MMKQKELKKILLVDDDPDSVDLLKIRLEQSGYQVFLGLDGLAGLRKARRQEPDLIILDAVMPKVDGVEFLKSLRKHEASAHIPVIVLTGNPESQNRFEALQCNHFAVKPVDTGMLMEKVRELLKAKILVCGDYQDFKEHIKGAFSQDHYRLDFVDSINDLFHIIAENRYFMSVVRLAQITDPPEIFVEKIMKNAMNPKMLTLIYSDAYVKGTESGEVPAIVRLEIEWMKAGNVIFYDSRIKGTSINDYLEDEIGL